MVNKSGLKVMLDNGQYLLVNFSERHSNPNGKGKGCFDGVVYQYLVGRQQLKKVALFSRGCNQLLKTF